MEQHQLSHNPLTEKNKQTISRHRLSNVKPVKGGRGCGVRKILLIVICLFVLCVCLAQSVLYGALQHTGSLEQAPRGDFYEEIVGRTGLRSTSSPPSHPKVTDPTGERQQAPVSLPSLMSHDELTSTSTTTTTTTVTTLRYKRTEMPPVQAYEGAQSSTSITVQTTITTSGRPSHMTADRVAMAHPQDGQPTVYASLFTTLRSDSEASPQLRPLRSLVPYYYYSHDNEQLSDGTVDNATAGERRSQTTTVPTELFSTLSLCTHRPDNDSYVRTHDSRESTQQHTTTEQKQWVRTFIDAIRSSSASRVPYAAHRSDERGTIGGYCLDHQVYPPSSTSFVLPFVYPERMQRRDHLRHLYDHAYYSLPLLHPSVDDITTIKGRALEHQQKEQQPQPPNHPQNRPPPDPNPHSEMFSRQQIIEAHITAKYPTAILYRMARFRSA